MTLQQQVDEVLAEHGRTIEEVKSVEGHCIQIWDDGEITSQKGGAILWNRTLHQAEPAVVPKIWIALEHQQGEHYYAHVSRAGAEKIRELIKQDYGRTLVRGGDLPARPLVRKGTEISDPGALTPYPVDPDGDGRVLSAEALDMAIDLIARRVGKQTRGYTDEKMSSAVQQLLAMRQQRGCDAGEEFDVMTDIMDVFIHG